MCVIEGLDWKCFRKGCVVFSVIIGLIVSTGLLLQYEHTKNASTICKDNLSCPANWICCDIGCCAPITASPRTENDIQHASYNPWYMQWPVLFFLGLLGGIVICCVWFLCRRNQSCGGFSLSCFCCPPRQHDTEAGSAGSLYPPPRYSRCGSFPQAPPPYSEVQSKPDLYPLVITCAEGDAKHGSGGSYLMVHYFRNCVIRPPQGSLSATSTAESLNSSFICNAANEANSIIPPPYSCSNFEEFALGCRRAELRSMSSLTEPRAPRIAASRPRDIAREMEWGTAGIEMEEAYEFSQALALRREMLNLDYRNRSWRQVSPTNQTALDEDEAIFEPHEFQDHHQPESLESPTSPSQTSQTSKEHRRPEERRQRRLDSIRRNMRKSSLYMPLSTASGRPSRISPGARMSSRSAPATPCSNLVPNLLNFAHRTSRHSSRSSRLEEEYDALILEPEPRVDHKF